MGRKTWAGFGVLLFSLMSLALIVRSATIPRHPITREAFEQIRLGMTEQEVEAVLGGPPGDYSSGTMTFVIEGKYRRGEGTEPKDWASDEGHIRVWFGDGKVAGRQFFDAIVIEDPFFNKLRRWMGL